MSRSRERHSQPRSVSPRRHTMLSCCDSEWYRVGVGPICTASPRSGLNIPRFGSVAAIRHTFAADDGSRKIGGSCGMMPRVRERATKKPGPTTADSTDTRGIFRPRRSTQPHAHFEASSIQSCRCNATKLERCAAPGYGLGAQPSSADPPRFDAPRARQLYRLLQNVA